MKAASSRQLFCISAELLDSLSVEEVDATYEDMVELGIEKPPFAEFDVQFPLKSYIDRLHREREHLLKELTKLGAGSDSDEDYGRLPDADLYCTYSFTLHPGSEAYRYSIGRRGQKPQHRAVFKEVAERFLRMFVVLLATRNVVREVRVNKLARLGIGKNSYCKTTLLKIGNVTEVEGRSEEAGARRRPHLRRGHIRHQKHGPGLSLEKRIFIPSIFVNADEGWIAERTSYRVVQSKIDEGNT